MAPAGQYKVQEAPSGRAKCQACKEAIAKGALRLGVLIENSDYGEWWKWRHWECVTDRVVKNMEDPSNLQGLDDLPEKYQDKVHATFEHPPAPKPRKQKSKKAAEEGDGEEAATVAAAAAAAGGKGKGKRGGAAVGDTVDAELPQAAPMEQAAPDPLEYLRDDLGQMLGLMMGGTLPEKVQPFFSANGASQGRLSVLISQLQLTGVLATPWPTPAHDLQMRLNFEAAQAAQAAAAAKKKASKKRRTRRPRGYDSDEDWP